MTGTIVQPSHEPPHERKGTGTRHTEKHQWRKNQQSLGGGGGRENGWQNPAQRKTERANESPGRCSQLLGMRIPKTADLRHLRHCSLLTPLNCIYMHFMVRSFHRFSVKLAVKCAFLAYGLKNKAYTWVVLLFLLMALRLLKSCDYIVEQYD